MSIFGSSGIRQIADSRLLELSLRVGLALGRDYPSVIIGRDTRTSSEALKNALAAGLSFSGSRPADAGVIPTPTLAFASREFALGAMITASHNPPEYNGIKLFNPDGSAFDAYQREKLEAALAGMAAVTSWDKMTPGLTYSEAVQKHLDAIVSRVQLKTPLKVVVDCGCGASSLVTPYLLTRLGCETISLYSYPSGHFPRPSEPSPENLSVLRQTVVACGADLGLAHDGDADRVVAVDSKGGVLPGDKLLIILARHIAAKRLVINMDCSMVIEDQGFEVVRTRVGDAYLSEALKKGGDFGGEPAGAFIFPGLSYCPDGIYGAALTVCAAAERPLSERAAEIADYPIVRGAVKGTRDMMPEIEKRLLALGSGSVDRTDGLRLAFPDGWLLVRPSGTEPKIRVTAEARTPARARELFEMGKEAVSRQ